MSRTTARGEATIRQVCLAFHICRQAYYQAKSSPRPPSESEIAGLGARGRQGPWATACELEAGIRRVVESHLGWGVRKVWATLRREGMKVSRKRVWAMMKALGLVLPPVRERDALAPRGQVVVAESNRRWATDLTTVWTAQDGLVALVPVIDCGDRSVLACEVTKSQDSRAVLSPVAFSLTAEFGDPKRVPWNLELRTDHGPQYTGADCEAMCAQWGLNHTLAPVGRPTGNAVAERVIQTLKVELIWTRDWASAAELRQAIAGWQAEYNHQRPHQALGWETPAERRARNLGLPDRLAA